MEDMVARFLMDVRESKEGTLEPILHNSGWRGVGCGGSRDVYTHKSFPFVVKVKKVHCTLFSSSYGEDQHNAEIKRWEAFKDNKDVGPHLARILWYGSLKKGDVILMERLIRDPDYDLCLSLYKMMKQNERRIATGLLGLNQACRSHEWGKPLRPITIYE